jgi:uncharacterized protein (TIGR02246 family)
MDRKSDIYSLPPDLPVPRDDGRAAHLPGTPLPSLSLVATTGERIDLSRVRGLAVVFAYPRTGQPNAPPLVPDWDLIPGARGCTPHTCSFRDLSADFAALETRIFGLSTQDPEYQRELAHRLHLPFPVLSDADLALTNALRLPTLTVAGHVLIARLAWIQRDGVIEQVVYPVFPPDRNGPEMLERVRAIRSAEGRAADDDRVAIDALRDAWVAVVASGDARGLADLVTPDYEVWAHGAPTLTGPQMVVTTMGAALARFSVSQSYEPAETVVAGDWAFQRGIERIRAVPKGGGPAHESSHRALLILRRGADGRWRYARGMTNGLPPAA